MTKDKLTKKQEEELQKITDGIIQDAKKVRLDYKDNPSEMSGSVTVVHENSPFLKEKHERLIKIDGKDFKIKSDTK
tara:strand:+ start:532 stop:759 length:228 start_codon:yes stop_codon:yes gene_type:complete